MIHISRFTKDVISRIQLVINSSFYKKIIVHEYKNIYKYLDVFILALNMF